MRRRQIPTAAGRTTRATVWSPSAPTASGGTVGSPANPAKVTLDGAGLLDGVDSHVKLGTKSPVPIVPLNANLTGLVYAKADLHSRDHQPVIVYDGKPSDNKIIYSGRLGGVSADSGGAMPFTWKPIEPGLHELHTVLLGSKSAGQDDEQILRVWVDSKPLLRQFTVSAAVDKSSVEVGGSVIISGQVTPTLSDADDRDVVLQVQKGDSWVSVGEKNTAADGAYSFTVPQPSAGSYVYRVKKNSAGGRSAAYSPELTVTVLKGFVVTARANPAAVDLGKSTTINGSVAPTQSSAANRKVQLQIRSGTSWVKAADGVTSASGAYAFTVKPRAEGSYAYRVLKLATSQLKAAASPTVTVKVTQQFTLTAKAKPTKLKVGKKTTISGIVTPRLASAKDRGVQLQVKKGSAWKKVSTKTTTRTGSYSFSVKMKKKGTFSYRVVKSAAAGKRAAASPTIKITVTKR